MSELEQEVGYLFTLFHANMYQTDLVTQTFKTKVYGVDIEVNPTILAT